MIVEARSSDAALHNSLGQIALTQPGGVLGHCPVEKQMIVPLSTTKWDGVLLQNAVVAMLVKCALNSKYITYSVTSKAPSHLLHASRWEPHIRSPSLTKAGWLEPTISNLDHLYSSDQRKEFYL